MQAQVCDVLHRSIPGFLSIYTAHNNVQNDTQRPTRLHDDVQRWSDRYYLPQDTVRTISLVHTILNKTMHYAMLQCRECWTRRGGDDHSLCSSSGRRSPHRCLLSGRSRRSSPPCRCRRECCVPPGLGEPTSCCSGSSSRSPSATRTTAGPSEGAARSGLRGRYSRRSRRGWGGRRGHDGWVGRTSCRGAEGSSRWRLCSGGGIGAGRRAEIRVDRTRRSRRTDLRPPQTMDAKRTLPYHN